MGFDRKWRCPICGQTYNFERDYKECVDKPVTHCYAKIGDWVKILNGYGENELSEVYQVDVIDKEWGHYAWKMGSSTELWHTQRLRVNLKDGGSRILTFWDYENPYTIKLKREDKLKRILKLK